jgi:hypothetical protein
VRFLVPAFVTGWPPGPGVYRFRLWVIVRRVAARLPSDILPRSTVRVTNRRAPWRTGLRTRRRTDRAIRTALRRAIVRTEQRTDTRRVIDVCRGRRCGEHQQASEQKNMGNRHVGLERFHWPILSESKETGYGREYYGYHDKELWRGRENDNWVHPRMIPALEAEVKPPGVFFRASLFLVRKPSPLLRSGERIFECLLFFHVR